MLLNVVSQSHIQSQAEPRLHILLQVASVLFFGEFFQMNIPAQAPQPLCPDRFQCCNSDGISSFVRLGFTQTFMLAFYSYFP